MSGTTGQVQAALWSLTFTPTAGQAALGQTVVTGFNLAIGDGFTTTLDQATSVAMTSLACFVAGTLIMTDRGGATSVENLVVGDLVRALAGDLAAVKWIGHRKVDCRRHPKPEKVWPVRVAADAFGENLPRRDLWLSPDHAVFVDRVLIPVKHLINGRTIEQEPLHEVTYHHVELEHHSVILAEGLPCESYLDTGDRSKFADGDGVVALYPDFSSRAPDIATIWEAKGCAPLVVTGTVLNSVRTRLLRHAGKLAVEPGRRCL